MGETSIWMMGIVAFGVIFYGFSIYYSNHDERK